ncbi:TRAP transporter large permease subunit [Chloroflexota bacterium]
MEWWVVLLIIFIGLMLLMTLGMPVAFAFMFINVVGVISFWGGGAGVRQLGLSIFSSLSKFHLIPVPLFIFMGEVMFQSGLGLSMVDALDKWMGRLPGRLGLLAVSAGTLFSTMSGSSMGSTAMLGSVLSPEMERRGYKKPISIGAIMGSGGLAMIIPPSGLAVLLASLAEISIGKLLIAGLIPGLIIAFFYATYIIGRCYLQPSIAPAYPLTPAPLSEKVIFTLKHILPLGLIIFMVLGFIFLGITTPSEAAATGALGTIILAAFYRRLNWKLLSKSISDTIMITSMIFMIIAGAIAFSQILAYSGASRGIAEFVTSLPLVPILVIMAMQIGAWGLGCIMSSIGVMMITVPIYMPIVYALGADPIWFALLLLINLEMGQTTPPFGLLLFTMKGVAPPDTTMGDIIRAGLPFVACDLAAMLLVVTFPILALWLPGLM